MADKVTKPSDIWTFQLSDSDIQMGTDYGIISHAWTYDRMNAQIEGNLARAIFRISGGVAVQRGIERMIFEKFGVKFKRDSHDYKEEDYWDVRTKYDKIIDVKSNHCFTDYNSGAAKERDPLSCELILNSNNAGEAWNTFFPMLIPRDQFSGKKDFYIFALREAPASKRYPHIRKDARFLITLPSSPDKELNRILHKARVRKFTKERIKTGDTFSIIVKRIRHSVLMSKPAILTAGYSDSTGEAKNIKLVIDMGQEVDLKGLTSLHYLRLHDNDTLPEGESQFEVTFHNIDEDDITWNISSKSFTDIWIYDCRVYCLGWISKEEFEICRYKYKSFAPRPDYTGNCYHNDKSARGLLSRKSFCYYYPPVFHGGTQTPNYYCLPTDLNRMDDIGEIL